MIVPSASRRLVRAIGALVLAFAPCEAVAHAFGARHELTLPLSAYLWAAAAAVALSFLVMGLVTALVGRRAGASGPIRRFDLGATMIGRLLANRIALAAIRTISVALFLLVLATAAFGSPDPLANFAPTFVWVLWWVGMSYISAFAGDLWRLVNPWATLFAWSERILPVLRKPRWTYPEGLGVWPAAFLFAVFAWFELVSAAGEQPRVLLVLIATYSLLTWTGMALFGREIWRERGELFGVFFGLLARFAVTGWDGERRRWLLRPPASGLNEAGPASVSMTVFVLLTLSFVFFDGLRETPAWAGVLQWVTESMTLRPGLLALRDAGFDLLKVVQTAGLLAVPVAFGAAYFLFCRLTRAAAGEGPGTVALAGAFAHSLVPIAIAYHLAHYVSYLLLAGQLAIPL
ncbi:MAG: hypothetical protein HOK81_15000, partial [Rhodospirillaceae bacterium]|nr:hypothetical protein [Rhodospirillaceae bacterium]